ncbi:MAG: NAD+ synthase [Leptospirales bacterium]|nr:NAD+ synthase [Leptospirales bacterium]
MKIAIAQINTTVADIEGNKNKIISFIKQAENSGADLVIFPELSTVGYPPMDLLERNKLIDDNIESFEYIKKFSADIKCAVLLGFISRNSDNPPMLYNSAALIAKGDIILRQNKLMPCGYDLFDESKFFTPGFSSATAEFMGRKMGIVIGGDISIDLVNQGADIIINVSASPYVLNIREERMSVLQQIALTNSVNIIFANQVGGNDSLIFDGNSFFVNREGEIYAHGKSFAEDLIIADIDSQNKIDVIIDPMEDLMNALVTGLRDYMFKSGFSKCLLGLSGGIDSALVAVIACEAVGAENVFSLTMPSQFSSSGSVDDSYKLAKNLGMNIDTVPIKNLYEQFLNELAPLFADNIKSITEENLQARIRGNLLMAVSNNSEALLLTTGNRSECATGYTTLYGDMCGGLAVISDISKTLVYKLSEYINSKAGKDIIPREIIDKEPSAELRPNQRDQDSLPPYNILDAILELYIDQNMSADEIEMKGFNRDIIDSVLHLVNVNTYKRFQAAPGLKVTSRSFGTDRKIPIVKKFNP